MRPIRLVIADRRPIVLHGFASLFAPERDFAVVASCLDGAGCLKAIRTLTPDLVLVEDGFSDVTASEMLAVVKAENIPTRLVFYTASVAHADLAAAIAAGSCCAISMREKPKTLMQSLRLVAPDPDCATADREENGTLAENGLAALTDQERKIMRLVASGMSNKEIARQLKVSTGIIKARLDHISTRLEIKSRTEVATFALSRLYGGIGALAALLFAALDDVKAADTTAFGHEPTDTFTVTTADGTAITVKINAKETGAASGKAPKAAFKAGRVENAIIETPGRASKLIPSSVDFAPGTLMPAQNSARPGLGSFGPFMITAVGVWICELLDSAAQASRLGDSFTVFASAQGSGTSELAALNSPGSADASLDGLYSMAWLHPETYDQSFAFAAHASEIIARNGDDLQIIAAGAGSDSVISDGNPHVGSGAIDALTDHGGFAQAAATEASGNPEHDRMQLAGGDESNDQSQRELHAAGDGDAAAEQHDKHGSPQDDSTYGQSQRDLQQGKDGTVVAAQHSKHDEQEDGSNRAQLQRDLHAPEDSSAATEHHARDDAKPASGANSGPSQRELHEASANAAESPHAGLSQHAGDKDQARAHSAQTQKAAAAEPGDSFHFRNEIAASQASSSREVHGDHGPASAEYDLHTAAGIVGVTAIHDADPIGASNPEQVSHATAAEHHLTHDFFV